MLGSPTSAANYTITINAGINVTSTSTGTPALRTGAFPASSVLKLINKGNIKGKGGDGGAGGYAGAGSNGGAGGDAIKLDMNMTVDNTLGNIWGGGGGGGGGAGGGSDVSGGGGA